MAKKNVANGTLGYFEPVVTHTFLPGCGVCGGAHPLARKGYSGDETVCPDCGANVAPPGPTKTERAELGGYNPMVLIGRLFLGIGKTLNNLSKRI